MRQKEFQRGDAGPQREEISEDNAGQSQTSWRMNADSSSDVLTPKERFETALRVAREAFRDTTLTIADDGAHRGGGALGAEEAPRSAAEEGSASSLTRAHWCRRTPSPAPAGTVSRAVLKRVEDAVRYCLVYRRGSEPRLVLASVSRLPKVRFVRLCGHATSRLFPDSAAACAETPSHHRPRRQGLRALTPGNALAA